MACGRAASDGREPPHASIVEWAADNIAVMRSLQPEGPYCLVGFSLGGIVAFEMARQLEAAGQPIGLLALIDSQLPVRESLSFIERLRFHAWKLWHRDDGGRWRYLATRWRLLVARLRRRNLCHQPEDVLLALDFPEQVREMSAAHFAALQAYQPGTYRGPFTLFAAGARWNRAAVAAIDPTLGWARWVEGPVEVHEIAATHSKILSKLLAGELAEALRRGARSAPWTSCCRRKRQHEG